MLRKKHFRHIVSDIDMYIRGIVTYVFRSTTILLKALRAKGLGLIVLVCGVVNGRVFETTRILSL